MKVIVTGAAGPRGRLVTTGLMAAGHAVVGVDTETWPDPPRGLQIHRLDLRKRGFEELLRHEPMDAIVHLALHAGFRLAPAVRYRLNLEGTGKVIRLAAEHAIRRVVVASHAAVYGALPDNPLFMTEDEPPAVGRAFPEMQDLVTADLMAVSAMWQHPEIAIAVLRPVHTLGPTSRDAFNVLLRKGRFPTVMGFDPMVQVIHETDLARAFVAAVEHDLRGVFNVTGPGEIPLSLLIEEAGARAFPMPGIALDLIRAVGVLRGGLGFRDVAQGAMEFLKHPCLIDGTRFRKATGFVPSVSLRETVRGVRARQRQTQQVESPSQSRE